ncbi:hypothetical protein LLG96_08215 [bacterium]|nr:hypothetical protein [bacterium]
MKYSLFIPLMLILLLISVSAVHADRMTRDLSVQDWGLYRDYNARWIDDEIYPPPADITKLQVNPPTCGWEGLKSSFERTVHLPATVEQYFWGDNGAIDGIAGDWRGVSWWVTYIDGSAALSGKKVFLQFESVHLRAEVFVNRTLVGYDVVGHTPFEVDITDAIKTGINNEIAVRVTDPGGSFDYNDLNGTRWGSNIIPTSHGIGGIQGRVSLVAVDPVSISDIYVKNKPSPKDVDVIIRMRNITGISQSGNFTVTVYPWKHPETVIWEKKFRQNLEPKESEHVFSVKAPRAELWDIDHPNLYTVEVSFTSPDGKIHDTLTQRFGFRWFTIGEKDGDQRFYLNGRRIVQINAYSWSFWPVNGIYPTREMAEKEMNIAKKLGYNMMSVHTAIPYPLDLDAADEAGLLFYSEPGGYYRRNNEEKTALRSTLGREKFLRMVQRDRSHPSLVIYNMGWNYYDKPEESDIKDMITAHTMDPTRIITFRQGIPRGIPKVDARKLFMKPDDFTQYHTGFFEECLSVNSQGYEDSYYKNPSEYYLHSDTRDEIVYWGEDGNLGSPPRLQLIRDYYNQRKEPLGWQGLSNLEWFKAYDEFLTSSGFRAFFPCVDSLTVSLGNVRYYHHGRILENIRIGNVADNYTIIGWGSSQQYNHNGMVDVFRNPVGNPEIFSRYCRPLYIAVKLREKVVPVKSKVIADFFIVNELDLKGPHNLAITVEQNGRTVGFEQKVRVKINGGEEYGQLLAENVEITLDGAPGYYTVKAQLTDNKGAVRAEGSDDVFTAGLSREISSSGGAVVDSTGIINDFLKRTWNVTLQQFNPKASDPSYIIIGKGKYQINDIMDRVANGATAIVIEDADKFAELVSEGFYEAVEYRGRFPMKNPSVGGNFVAGKHELLEGLPQVQAFNWEYQVFYRYDQDIFALRLFETKPIVAAVYGHKKEIGTAVCIVPFGRGRIILSTLCIVPYLKAEIPQAVVAQRLLNNYIEYASKVHKSPAHDVP